MTGLGDVAEEFEALPLIGLDLSRFEEPPGLFTAVGEVFHELRLRQSLRHITYTSGFHFNLEA